MTKNEDIDQLIGINPDRPLGENDTDKLGFTDFAKNILSALTNSSTRHGLVIGIEGKWGSGKSSVINLIKKAAKEQERISFINFEPWIVGSRESLITELFKNLAQSISVIEENEGKNKTGRFNEKANELSKDILKYSRNVARGLVPLAKIAEISGIPHAGFLAKILGQVKDLPEEEAVSLYDQKERIKKGLLSLDHKFIVLVDDIDRLAPQEAAEISRLIKAVGDFPNVIYVLCYDEEIFAHSLKESLKVESGENYLQKIVQVGFSIPKPEEFDLRRWLFSDCVQLYQEVSKKDLEDQELQRLSAACDLQGSKIETPREVVLIMNRLKAMFPALNRDIDYTDLCWLQILYVTDRKLYDWVQKYLICYASIQIENAQLNSGEYDHYLNSLSAYFPNETEGTDILSSDRYRFLNMLSEHLLGISTGLMGKDKRVLFTEENDERRKYFDQAKRIGSPNHYKLYFSFTSPSGTISDSNLNSLIEELTKESTDHKSVIALINSPRPQGGTKFEIFLDRLLKYNLKELNPDELRYLMRAIGDTVDLARAKEREPGAFRFRFVYRAAATLYKEVCSRFKEQERKDFIESTFKYYESIGWLLVELIGNDVFCYPQFKTAGTKENAFFTYEELTEIAIPSLFERLQSADRDKIKAVPAPLSFYYRWKQAGGEKDLRAWVDEYVNTDENFLDFLDNCRGLRWSDKMYRPLHYGDLNEFMDADNALVRLREIHTKNNKLHSKASDILDAVKDGDWPT